MDSVRVPRDTLVQRLNVEITALTRATAAALPDDEMNRRLDELFTAVGRLVQAAELNAPELDADAVGSFGQNLWSGDFIFAVSRDFVRNCTMPALILPAIDTPHPRATGVELAELLPNSECLVDWKGPEHFDEQRQRVVTFLAKHTPQ